MAQQEADVWDVRTKLRTELARATARAKSTVSQACRQVRILDRYSAKQDYRYDAYMPDSPPWGKLGMTALSLKFALRLDSGRITHYNTGRGSMWIDRSCMHVQAAASTRTRLRQV